jgi:hypothetical protein
MPALKNTRLRPRIDGRVVTLGHEIQECGSVKKKKKKKKVVSFNNDVPKDPTTGVDVDDEETSFYDAVSNHPIKMDPSSPTSIDPSSIDPSSDPSLVPIPNPSPVPSPEENSGVDSDKNSAENPGVSESPPGLDCSLNQDGHWGANAHSACAYVLNTIALFTKFEASLSTPQYGFNRGMKEFGELGFEATMKELDDNLIGMDAVRMLDPSEVNKEVWSDALSYLMFLKRKRDGTVKARGCTDGRPQREYISKDESSSPTVSIYALIQSCAR